MNYDNYRLWPILFLVAVFSGISYGQNKDSLRQKEKDTILPGKSLSGYESLHVVGGQNSVDADLKNDDVFKDAWLSINYSKKIFASYYDLKRKLYKKTGMAIGLDYMFLNQYASFSYSDKQAASGIFRLYGTWEIFRKKANTHGALITKIENRHTIGTGLVPRNLGYEAGSALSTASFKDFDWGLTNFYWKQAFSKQANGNHRIALVVGIMDPGDWVDLYPLLNSYKFYLNEAFFNSPAMALPNQGLGAAAVYNFVSNFYVSGGIHDANGEPTNFIFDNIDSFFTQKEYFTWIEAGYKKTSTDYTDGNSVHLTYWHQDARSEKDLEESYGWSFSASKVFPKGITAFLRADISNGNAPVLHHIIATGVTLKPWKHDILGFGFNWGGPSDRSKRDQYGLEVFYALQLTQNLNIMPDIQFTINPSFNTDKNLIGVYSVIRLRYAM